MKQTIDIRGMHCVSCEILLEKSVKKIPWVTFKDVSYKKGILEIEYKKPEQYTAVKQAIEKNGFSLKDDTQDKPPMSSFILMNIIALLLVVILLIASYIFDIYQYIPDTSTLSYSWAFLVWIIASLSTCLAITWGIIIGFSKYLDGTHDTLWHLKVQWGFQLGRILWFFLLGGLLGATGKLISINFWFTAIVTFFIGILLLYMWLNVMWLLPSLSRFGIHMPKSFATKVEALGKPQYAPIVWAGTFFLPCGFTQTMQLLAISSGSFISGWLVMLFFALGTLPVLFSVGMGSSYFQDKKLPILNTVIASILVFFGIITIYNSSNLLSFYAPKEAQAWQEVSTKNLWDTEIVTVWHNGWNTEPQEIVLKKGKNYQVVITPDQDGRGCMSTQVIPKIKSQVSYVKAGQDIVYNFNNPLPGKYEIVCASMWMLQGIIVVK